MSGSHVVLPVSHSILKLIEFFVNLWFTIESTSPFPFGIVAEIIEVCGFPVGEVFVVVRECWLEQFGMECRVYSSFE